MTYAPDGGPVPAPYNERAEEGTVAVGWLDRSHPFPQGAVSQEFVERLRTQCRDHCVNRTRGWHGCNLGDAPEPYPTSVPSPIGEFNVGSAEIRVQGASGTLYAAPNMIIHYVETHGYKPPDDFIEGVLADHQPEE